MSKRKFNSNNNYERDCNSNLEVLDKIRREDILEGYQEETEESFSLNKRPVLSDSEDSIDEDGPTSSSNKSLNSSSKSYKRYATANSEESEEKSPEVKKPSFSEHNVAARLMQKMGFTGKGLGKHEQGIQSPIEASSTRGRLGLGHDAQRDLQLDYDEKWDTESEVKNVEENPNFLKCEQLMESQRAIQAFIDQASIYSNLVMGKPVTDIVSQDRYCNGRLISELVNAKNVFNHLTEHQLNEARARANPYETIKSGIFQNRAAMKTANLDRIFGWRLSQEFDDTVRGSKNPFKEHQDQERKNDSRQQSAFYFVDVCAGPGGFSEYMLWRKAFYNAKGFGFTLKGPDDFKLWKFKAASSAYFDPFYGKNDDGNIMAPENLETLEEYITRKTNNQKVHLVMADGGFSVKDDYNLQEVLSKRLYLCQFIAGLSLCRAEDKEKKKRGGNFVCKLFDIFTPFSVGLIYLMYLSFDQISLHKPNTSRPANSERYIFCENLNSFGATSVKKYLVQINNELQRLEQDGKNKENDILEILPAELIEKDEEFFNYVKDHNEDLIQRQILYLDKYRKFAKNPGAYDPDQGDLRVRCLEYWEVPDKKKEDMYNRRQNVGDLFHEVTKWKMPINEYRFKINAFTLDVLRNQEDKRLRLKEVVATLLTDDKEPMFVVSVGDKVYCRDWNGNDWRLLNELSLVLPTNTVLLAHVAVKTIRSQNSERVLRILDAPVLDGDWIADLSYMTRILAIKKFCATVNKPGHKQFDSRARRESFIAHNELVCAEVFSISRLVEYLEKMKANYRGGQTALFPCESEPHSANDERKEYFACKAVRFMNILKDNFIACWSNSSKRVYYNNRETRQSYFDDVAEKEHVFSSFWDTIKKSNDYSSSHEYTWLWKWYGDSHSRYGPAKILSSDLSDHDVTSQNLENSHPTLVSLQQLIEDEKARVPRV